MRMPGEVLDTGDWMHGRARQLCNARLLEPVPYEAPEAVACKCKRAWSPDIVEVPSGKCPVPEACMDPKVVAGQITSATKADSTLSGEGTKVKAAYEKRREMSTAAATKE